MEVKVYSSQAKWVAYEHNFHTWNPRDTCYMDDTLSEQQCCTVVNSKWSTAPPPIHTRYV